MAFRDGHKTLSDPRGTMMTEARIMTFGKKWWPHEDKRGWLPKIETVSFGFIFYFYERLVLT